MFEVGAVPSDPYHLVTVERLGRKQPLVRIHAGTLFGVGKTTKFSIYPAGTPRFAGVKPIGHAKVVSVGPYECVVAPIGVDASSPSLMAARALILGDNDERKYRAVSQLSCRNSRIRIQLEAVPLAASREGSSREGPLSAAVSTDQSFTFRVRATGPDGKPLVSTDDSVFLQLLGCTPNGRVLPLWPQTAQSSEVTRLVADGKWRYLSQDGSLIDEDVPSQLGFWQMDPADPEPEEIFKLIGTSETVDYGPVIVDHGGEGSKLKPSKWSSGSASPRKPRSGVGIRTVGVQDSDDVSVATVVLHFKPARVP
jgi:hypothetical protein